MQRALCGVQNEKISEIELDLGRYQLRRRGRPVKLGKKPMELLIFLVGRREQLVSRKDCDTSFIRVFKGESMELKGTLFWTRIRKLESISLNLTGANIRALRDDRLAGLIPGRSGSTD